MRIGFYLELARTILLILIFGVILFGLISEASVTAPAPLMEVMEPEPVEIPKPVVLAATIPEPVVFEPLEVAEPETVEPVEEEPAEPAPNYTPEELEMLALVIYREAGADACSDDTRLKVGTVVMNPVADDRFPGTLYEVLTQPSQYGRLHWTGLVWPERASTEAEAHAVKRAYDCAERILMGERFLPEDVVFQAEFTQGTEVVAHQEGFYFCR
jgi:hypothetical protein